MRLLSSIRRAPEVGSRAMRQLPALTLLAALLLPLGAAAQAPEDPRVTQARARFDRADTHYQAEDYALALEEYRAAYDLMVQAGHPNAILILFNVARTNERLERLEVALSQFEQFLVDAPQDSEFRDRATRHAANIRRILELRGEGAAEDEGGGGGISPIGIVIAAVGAATAITGGILGAVALSESDAARVGCVDMACPADARDGIASAQTLANVSDGLLFGGLAVAATGVVLMFVLGDGGGETTASAGCGPNGCGAMVRGSF